MMDFTGLSVDEIFKIQRLAEPKARSYSFSPYEDTTISLIRESSPIAAYSESGETIVGDSMFDVCAMAYDVNPEKRGLLPPEYLDKNISIDDVKNIMAGPVNTPDDIKVEFHPGTGNQY